MPHDVFVSHSSPDKSVADATVAALEAAGIRCWIAPRDIRPGETWGASIVEAINQSRIMVLIFSSAANISPQVLREVTRAVEHEVIIVPFRVEEVLPSGSLQYFLSAVHWLDALTPDLEHHIQDLRAAIEAHLCEDGVSVSGPQPPAARTSEAMTRTRAVGWRRLRAPLGVGALLLVGFAAVIQMERRDAAPTAAGSAVVWRSAEGLGEWKQLSKSDWITEGDHLRIQFRPSRESRWYAFQVDGRKLVDMHFPNAAGANPVGAGVEVTLPGPGLALRVDGTIGSDRFYFLRTETHERALEQFAEEFTGARELERAEDRLPGEGRVRRRLGSEYERQLQRLATDLEQRCEACVQIEIFDHR